MKLRLESRRIENSKEQVRIRRKTVEKSHAISEYTFMFNILFPFVCEEGFLD